IYPLIFAYTTLIERKALARIQNRYGPNRVGRWGILQPIADGVKLLLKEDIVPAKSDKTVHFLAPVLAVIPSLLLFSVLPIAPGLAPVDLNIGVLFVFAVSTASVLALFMGGWASRNKFSLLGAMRAVAQVVSYEVPMVLSAVVVLMAVGSLSTLRIVEAQSGGFANIGGWFVFQPWGFVGFALFTIGAMAESARTPFDIPEAESEIIAGYHTEYSGFKFALFQLGEYLAAIAMAGVAVTMFLGGYLGPGSGPGIVGGLISACWFFTKLMLIVLTIIWIRGTWPRIRVDQLLEFAWKVLLPLSLINIVAFACWHYLAIANHPILAWLAAAVILVVSFVLLTRLSSSGKIEKRTYRYAT
ncbi:MAG: NADH-quinone oxidoreductase subunit NuoH, partial [Gammaproteobacteria bacterium]